jgi:hypothetical protein
MTNKTLLTNDAKLFSVQQMYYSPVSYIQNLKLSTMYCFLSRVESWSDEQNPPTPTQDQKSIKKIMKSIFAAKQIHSNDISPVIQRIDWTTNTTYKQYQDNINMFELDTNGYLLNNFYVRNKYDQIFKCLDNNLESVSIDEPYFEPGSYNTNNIYTGPNDNYKWKYIYTIETALKVKFLDKHWMPIPISKYTPNPTQTSAGCGSIDVINLLNGGTGYHTETSIISVNITGDGTGAAASVVANNGIITDIIVTSPGSNYTYANVSITSTDPTAIGAEVAAPISPIGGHGFDPLSELGCTHVMITASFNGTEADLNGTVIIPTDIDYHQLGILINPTAKSTAPDLASGSIYKTTTDIIVASGSGIFSPDEIVYQGTSLNTATFTGTVLSFDANANILKLINTSGTITTNLSIFGLSGETRTVLTYSIPDLITLSGYIAYIENRSSIQRSIDGIEQFKIVLGY